MQLLLVFVAVFIAAITALEDESPRTLQEVDADVAVLTNELKRLKAQVQVLKGDPETGSEDALRPLEASRRILPGGRVQFTVSFKAPIESRTTIKAFWINMTSYVAIQETLPNTIPFSPLEPDVYSTSILATASDIDDVSVAIGIPSQWYRIYLENSATESVTEAISSLPVLSLDQPGDIVYTPGHNITVTVVAPKDQRSPNPGLYIPENFKLEYFLNPAGTDVIAEQINSELDMADVVDVHPEKHFFDTREISMTFLTAVTPLSGLVELVGSQSYVDQRLVSRIDRGIQRVLRPTTQTGAFRDGLIAARNLHWMERDDHGNYAQRCRVGEECQLFCMFFGNNLSPVTLLKTANGVTQTVTHHKNGEALPSSSYVQHWFQMTADMSSVNYTCVTSDVTGNTGTITTIVQPEDPYPSYGDFMNGTSF